MISQLPPIRWVVGGLAICFRVLALAIVHKTGYPNRHRASAAVTHGRSWHQFPAAARNGGTDPQGSAVAQNSSFQKAVVCDV